MGGLSLVWDTIPIVSEMTDTIGSANTTTAVSAGQACWKAIDRLRQGKPAEQADFCSGFAEVSIRNNI